MPILLDQIQDVQVNQTKLYPATFFSSKLNGTGKKKGLLSEFENPINAQGQNHVSTDHLSCYKHTYTNGLTKVSHIPIAITPYDIMPFMQYINIPTDKVKIGYSSKYDVDYFINLAPYSMILEEKQPAKKGDPTERNLSTCYRAELYIIPSNMTLNRATYSNINMATTLKYHIDFAKGYYMYTCNPAVDIWDKLTATIPDIELDKDELNQFIISYSLYESVIEEARKWNEDIHLILKDIFENIKVFIHSYPDEKSYALNSLAQLIRNIEKYNIPLDIYRNIYEDINNIFDKDIADILYRQNLNLLLSQTLNDLNNNKDILEKIPDATVPLDPKYSKEQIAAITTKEPLALIQAGAGTGKSTTILARIDYMVKAGVKPEDITVLSFTNAAADNITLKNPNVHSMTIAKMIHLIYTANFKHELSNIDTIINSLEIYYPTHTVAQKFCDKLKSVARGNGGAFTSLNNFIENNYDEVIKILDRMKQTSLELEIIICYQQIDNLIEPSEITSKHLIIDEVQDTSIFEFIYALKYVDKHEESLFMVGRQHCSL